MIRKSTVIAVAAMVLLSGCDSLNWIGDKINGTSSSNAPASIPASGAAAPATAKPATTLSGILLGNQPGSMVDENDLKQANAAETKAYMAPIGQLITWNNPQKGNSGTITPVKDGYSKGGAYCREFQESIIVGGQQKQGEGYACQQPDGSWKIVSQ